MSKDKVVETVLTGIVIGVFVSLTAFIGSAILRTYRNEEKIFANEGQILRNREDNITTHMKIDKIYDHILKLESEKKEVE